MTRTAVISLTLVVALTAAGVAPSLACAQEPAGTAVATDTAVPAPTPLKHWVLHFNVGLMLASWKGSIKNGAGPNAEGWRDLTNRQTIAQFVGVGYFFTPQFRVTASLLFAETVGGLRQADATRTPPVTAEGPFTSASLVTWAAYHPVPWFFVGAGPIFAARAYDLWQFDFGLLLCAGASAALGGGFSLGGVIQSPFMFGVRGSWTLVAAVMLGYRF